MLVRMTGMSTPTRVIYGNKVELHNDDEKYVIQFDDDDYFLEATAYVNGQTRTFDDEQDFLNFVC